ncbi:hypothetical protein OsJ_09497 [Oryza sativa Japonica Group]|uniref:Uncharacterized protein n=1 Tax=Oryza sativa subsp. japonica TaxID=39947 RepID=B9FBF9_ORYSJ|nr:hypothetical protein OsJ_09497 [Oryza sativa Japonica Group]
MGEIEDGIACWTEGAGCRHPMENLGERCAFQLRLHTFSSPYKSTKSSSSRRGNDQSTTLESNTPRATGLLLSDLEYQSLSKERNKSREKKSMKGTKKNKQIRGRSISAPSPKTQEKRLGR